MRVVYWVYPVVLWLLCYLFWVAASILGAVVIGRGHRFLLLLLFLLCSFPASLLAWFLTELLVARFPRIHFATKDEIVGFGYVHAPFDVLVPFWMMSVLTGVFCLIGQIAGWW
jgi:hypothetical protein